MQVFVVLGWSLHFVVSDFRHAECRYSLAWTNVLVFFYEGLVDFMYLETEVEKIARQLERQGHYPKFDNIFRTER